MNVFNGSYAPITDGWGFLKAPLTRIGDEVLNWQSAMRPQRVSRSLKSSLYETITLLRHGTDWPILLGETASEWVAVFWGAGSWPESIIGHMTTILKCEGMLVSDVVDATAFDGSAGRPGGTQMMIFGGPGADRVLNISRVVSVTNQINRGEFDVEGRPLPFEELTRYKSRRVRDRFDRTMLEKYCQALGIELYDEGFYGPEFVLIADSDSASMRLLSTGAIKMA